MSVRYVLNSACWITKQSVESKKKTLQTWHCNQSWRKCIFMYLLGVPYLGVVVTRMQNFRVTEKTTRLVLAAAAMTRRMLFLDRSHLLLRMVLETSAHHNKQVVYIHTHTHTHTPECWNEMAMAVWRLCYLPRKTPLHLTTMNKQSDSLYQHRS